MFHVAPWLLKQTVNKVTVRRLAGNGELPLAGDVTLTGGWPRWEMWDMCHYHMKEITLWTGSQVRDHLWKLLFYNSQIEIDIDNSYLFVIDGRTEFCINFSVLKKQMMQRFLNDSGYRAEGFNLKINVSGSKLLRLFLATVTFKCSTQKKIFGRWWRIGETCPHRNDAVVISTQYAPKYVRSFVQWNKRGGKIQNKIIEITLSIDWAQFLLLFIECECFPRSIWMTKTTTTFFLFPRGTTFKTQIYKTVIPFVFVSLLVFSLIRHWKGRDGVCLVTTFVHLVNTPLLLRRGKLRGLLTVTLQWKWD